MEGEIWLYRERDRLQAARVGALWTLMRFDEAEEVDEQQGRARASSLAPSPPSSLAARLSEEVETPSFYLDAATIQKTL